MKKILNKLSIVNYPLSIALLLAAMMTLASCAKKAKPGDAGTPEATTPATTGQSASDRKRIPFEHGSYVQESKAMGMDMKQTVYFDRWGDWMAMEMKMESFVHILYLSRGDRHWEINLIEKTGKTYQSSSPMPAMGGSLADVSAYYMQREGVEVKELGNEDRLGYKCKKTHFIYPKMEIDATIITYGNLVMQMDGKMGKMDVATRITSIDLAAPPASIFEVPDGIVLTEQ